MLRLADGRDGAEEHRQHRQERQDLLPVADDAAEGVMHARRANSAIAATLGAVAKNAVTGVGEPS